MVCRQALTCLFQSLRYLKNPALPCVHQKAKSLKDILKAISLIEPIPTDEPGMDHGLTKIEKLMLVNLAPTKPVDLNIVGTTSPLLDTEIILIDEPQIIDDLDVRFSEEAQDQILSIFADSMQAAGVAQQADNAMDIVKQETDEMKEAEDEAEHNMEQLDEEIYDQEEHYNDEEVMPDEENDLSKSDSQSSAH